jgi:uncharacterized protein with PIN domain
MTTPRRSSFDRVRPRSAQAGAPIPVRRGDAQGRRALFSATDAERPAPGSIVLDCSACGRRSALSIRQAVRAALPSLHLPLLRRTHPSWMRCPACTRRTWVKIGVTW